MCGQHVVLPKNCKPERLDDPAGNELRKTVERWDNRLKLEGLSVPEAYLEGRLSLLLNLKRYRSGEFCDIEYRIPSDHRPVVGLSFLHADRKLTANRK